MEKLIAENQPLMGFISATVMAFLVHFHFSDFVIDYTAIALVVAGAILLTKSNDVIDRRIGYAVGAAIVFVTVTSFFASESELTDPGWALTVKGATWIIFLANLWAIGRLLDSKNQKASRVIRITAGTLFVIGVAISYLRQAT